MSDLTRELELLRGRLEFPPTPDLASAVTRRIGQPEARRERPASRRGRPPRRLALALAAALVLLAALMAAVPSARDAVRDLFGLRGATVEVRPRLPEREAAEDPKLGRHVSLARARRTAGFRILVPELLGPPAAVHLKGAGARAEITLSYRGGGLLVSQFQGEESPDYVGKIAAQTNRVERFPGGVWIEGAPHFFFYRNASGAIREDSLRLAGDVLLLERGRLLVRVEGARSKRRALRIARSLG